MMRAVLCLVVLATACKREERTFSGPAASASPLTLAPPHTFVPGATPNAGGSMFDATLPGYIENAQAISDGMTLYDRFNCSGCHANGGGGIGPALIDFTWRYGSAPREIAETIIAGRPDGMPSYRGKLASTQLYDLVAYVRTLGGLARGDAVPARQDHMKVTPSPSLQHLAIPMPSQERP